MHPTTKRPHRPIREEVFREYCATSSIHGVRYFDKIERTSCERFWWVLVFLLSMGGCGVMIYKAYVKWNQAPIIVTFSEKTTPVWEVKFPAVTICPETKVPSAKLNFTAEINALSDVTLNRTVNEEIVGQLKVVAQLCNPIFHSNHYFLNFINGTREDDVVNMLKNMALPRYKVIGMCIYDDQYNKCEEYLKETLTEEGLCYSFNMISESAIFRKSALHTNHNYMENWLEFANGDMETPLHARGAGMHAGFSMYLIESKADIDYMCTVSTNHPITFLFSMQGFSQGYKLMLHEANEYPQVSKRNIRIPLSHEISIALKPQMIVTSPSAADYGWEKRQCFFNKERHLQFFQIYNQENCELECLTNLTLVLCGCVRFSMPRANETKVCPLYMWDCMFQARSLFRQHDNASHPEEVLGIFANCNCLPACSSVHYDAEITQSSLDVNKFLDANKLRTSKANDIIITTLEIYFKESHFITSKRSELYGLVDFLANCGGLLGLFMGVSILSLLEICYFIAIRPFSINKRRALRGDNKEKEVSNSLLAVVSKAD
ncbi:pickpocket protein 28-like [Anopheles nili]|uniref:pickpocket protein 28-like n=1 Tax=Anopheles nili TaxID=185578 RepID=UPI00237B556F|nr:pickpocket protein 28-like [Anopheles nili]